ncbi:MAG TPA: polyprenol monophosphomannose synthase [Chloroflexota bacterium]
MQESPPGRRTLVVLPTYNEHDNLIPMVEAIRANLPQAVIWIVDDNSPDGTGRLADELAANDPHVEVVHRPCKQGLGVAYVDAFQRALAADYDAVIEMDADFSHDPRYLPELLAGLEDADLVLGSRYIAGGGTRNWSPVRQAISRGGNIVARVGLGIKVRDATGGYRAFRRSTLHALDFDELQLRGYGFQIEVVYQVERRGLQIKEVPIVFVERAVGTSKMSKGIVLAAVLHIIGRRLRALRHAARARSSGG